MGDFGTSNVSDSDANHDGLFGRALRPNRVAGLSFLTPRFVTGARKKNGPLSR